MRERGVEFLRYFGCSAVALAADVGAFKLLLGLGAGYVIAAAIAFAIGLGVAYQLSVRFAFRHRRLINRQAEFAVFSVIGLFGLLLTEGILWLLVERARVDPVSAKFAAAGLVFLSNYTLRRLALFSARTERTPAHAYVEQ